VDDLGERDAIARSAPGGDEDIGIQRADVIGVNLLARLAEEFAASGSDQLSNPRLRRDDGLSPFFAEDARTRKRGGDGANALDFVLHDADKLLASIGAADAARDQHDVGIDMGSCSASEWGARPRKRAPDLRISLTAFSW